MHSAVLLQISDLLDICCNVHPSVGSSCWAFGCAASTSVSFRVQHQPLISFAFPLLEEALASHKAAWAAACAVQSTWADSSRPSGSEWHLRIDTDVVGINAQSIEKVTFYLPHQPCSPHSTFHQPEQKKILGTSAPQRWSLQKRTLVVVDVFLDLTHPFPWRKLSSCVSSASLNFVPSFQNLKQSTCQEHTTKTRQSWKISWSRFYWAPKWQNLHPSSMYGEGSTRLCCWSSAPTGQSSSSNGSSDAWGSNGLQALPAVILVKLIIAPNMLQGVHGDRKTTYIRYFLLSFVKLLLSHLSLERRVDEDNHVVCASLPARWTALSKTQHLYKLLLELLLPGLTVDNLKRINLEKQTQ